MKIYRKLLALFTIWVTVYMLNFSNAVIPGWQNYTPLNTDWLNAKVWSKDNLTIEEWVDFAEKPLGWLISYDKKSNYGTSLERGLALVQSGVNWTLAILATVAVVVILYNGFMILSSWSNDKNSEKGKSWIKTAAIALVGLLLSRVIISAMIRFIRYVSKT